MAAGSDQEQNRTEPATPFKLRQARKRGQVAKSLEINSLLILSVALLVIYAWGEVMLRRQFELSRELINNAHRLDLDVASAMGLYEFVLRALGGILGPFVIALVITAVLANLSQTGPIFSFFPLKPDVTKLNPVNGFKRVFSKKLLFESIKSIIKMTIFGSVIFFGIKALLPAIMAMIDADPQVYPTLLMDQGRGLIYKLLLVLVIIALADLLYSRWDYARQMRMSRREVKEEVKRREGDPQIRARIRQLQKEAVHRAGAVEKVPEADVLIANPTRLAVALQYEREVMPTPRVIAKGANGLAAKMRELARRHKVPIVENPSLARTLFRRAEIGEGIPEAVFPVVAKILAWIYLQKEKHSGRVR
jgi:flagellar biosynthetic protein FlhB